MSWPANPTNGQEVTKNGVLFRYNSSSGVWNRVRQLSASLPGGGASYGNSDVASYLPTYTGNISAGNVKTDHLLYANGTAYTIASFTNDSNYATQSYVTSQNYITSSALTGYATETYVGTQVSNLVNSAPAALDTLNELANALGNDASYSTTITNSLANKLSTSSFTSTADTWLATKSTSNVSEGTNQYYTVARANTAIDNRVTKTFVDNLSVVANTVASSSQPNITSLGSLANLTVSGLTTSQLTSELITAKASATGVVAHDVTTSSIFYHTSISASFTANFTNFPTTNNRSTVVILVLIQGATPYIPSAVQIDGVAQTINWASGSAPTGNANKKDFVAFTFLRVGDAWSVFGQLATYG